MPLRPRQRSARTWASSSAAATSHTRGSPGRATEPRAGPVPRRPCAQPSTVSSTAETPCSKRLVRTRATLRGDLRPVGVGHVRRVGDGRIRRERAPRRLHERAQVGIRHLGRHRALGSNDVNPGGEQVRNLDGDIFRTAGEQGDEIARVAHQLVVTDGFLGLVGVVFRREVEGFESGLGDVPHAVDSSCRSSAKSPAPRSGA